MDKDTFEKTGNAFYGPVTFNGPMFDIHDNQRVENHVHYREELSSKELKESEEVKGVKADTPLDTDEKVSALAPALATPEGRALLERLTRAGVLDEAWRPVGLSLAEKGVLAGYIAARLGIEAQWQTFARLWDLRPETLRSAYNKGMEQKKTARFLDRVRGGG